MWKPFSPFLLKQVRQQRGLLADNPTANPLGTQRVAPAVRGNPESSALLDRIDRLLAQTFELQRRFPLPGQRQGAPGAPGPQPPEPAGGGASPLNRPLGGNLPNWRSSPALGQHRATPAPVRQLAAVQQAQQPVPVPQSGVQVPAGARTPLKLWPVPSRYELNKPDKGGEGAPGFMDRAGNHHGIDIQAPSGTGVFAAGDGVVVRVDGNDARGYGLQVVIDHGNGLFTQYAHLGTAGVKVGQKVIAGMQIGEVGQSGNVPRGGDPHLHFEVRKWDSRAKSQGGHVVDPFGYLPDISGRFLE